MIQNRIKSILADVLDIEAEEIGIETDLIREIGAESIDLLEIALSLEREFGIRVDENRLFLKSFRLCVDEAKQKNVNKIDYLKKKYPFLTEERINELIGDIEYSIMPSIKVKDLISYVEWLLGGHNKEKKKHKKV